jgi:hypothetical protein
MEGFGLLSRAIVASHRDPTNFSGTFTAPKETTCPGRYLACGSSAAQFQVSSYACTFPEGNARPAIATSATKKMNTNLRISNTPLASFGQLKMNETAQQGNAKHALPERIWPISHALQRSLLCGRGDSTKKYN